MTTYFDDEKLAAYALGELDDEERGLMEELVKTDEAVQRTVAEFCAAARLAAEALRTAVAPALSEAQQHVILEESRKGTEDQVKALPSSGKARFWRRAPRRWRAGLALAAGILLVAGLGAVIHGGRPLVVQYSTAGRNLDLFGRPDTLLDRARPSGDVDAWFSPSDMTYGYDTNGDGLRGGVDVHDLRLYAKPASEADVPAGQLGDQLQSLPFFADNIARPEQQQSAKEDTSKLPDLNANSGAAQPDRYLIKTATLSIEADDAQQASRQLTDSVEAVGGYVSDLQEQVDGLGRRTVRLQVRVPADRLDATMQGLEALGRVLSKKVSTADVTEEYVDTDARIRNLKRTEERLLDHLSKAILIDSTLKIEQELSRVREQLERLEGRMRFLSHRVQFSTIDVHFQEKPKAETVIPVQTFSSGRVASEALRSLVEFAQTLWGKAIWIVVWSPIWAVALLVLWQVYRQVRNRVTVWKRKA